MDNLPALLSPIKVQLDQLLLDPNNPRFSELGEVLNSIPESRFADAKVQANTYEKMRDAMFDVAELRDTIKAIGFLPMDRVVVREWRVKAEPTQYVVIEGNRRVTALKWLMSLHEIGKETFDEERILNYTHLECLLLDDKLASASATLILPGLRHVSGIKSPFGNSPRFASSRSALARVLHPSPFPLPACGERAKRLFGKLHDWDSQVMRVMIQALDVDRAEPWPDGEDRPEDEALSVGPDG